MPLFLDILEQAFRADLPEAEFDRLATGLLAWQAEHNPVYRRFLDASGIQGNPGNWQTYPALPVSAFRTDPVACFPVDQAKLVFETSGTTGKETGKHYLADSAHYEASILAGFRHFMPDLQNHRWISLIPAAAERPHSSLAHMISYLDMELAQGKTRYLADHAFQIKPPELEKELASAGSREPVALFGTSFALAQSAETVLARQTGAPFQLHPDSVVFDTGGYKGRHRDLTREELIELLVTALGIHPENILNEYGMTELCSQGYGKLDAGIHHFPPWMRVRIIDPGTGRECKTGEQGLLHFYDLANVHSVMAIATLDTGIREQGGIRLLGRSRPAPARGCSLPYESAQSA